MNRTRFDVVFWGVRGSLPVPGPNTVRYGGNTPCVQVQIGQTLLIMDAGTGIYHLGRQLMDSRGRISGHVFITHTHWDHIQGFPFFYPAFVDGNEFVIYGQRKGEHSLFDLMQGQMAEPYFPVHLSDMFADIRFQEVEAGEILTISDGITVKTISINHPGGCLAYRVDHDGRSLCYVTDTEDYPFLDPGLIDFARKADVVVYDANFTEEEYLGLGGKNSKKGWGHSTWQQGVRLVREAEADMLVLFHHAVYRNDDDMDALQKAAQKEYPRCVAAREGMVISL